jgi:hypothetical protein
MHCTVYKYMYDPENCNTKVSHPNMKFGTAKPSGAIPMGRTVKASTNIQLVRIGLVISVDYEHGDRIDRLVPAPAIRSVTQVGRIIVHRDAAKEEQIFLLYNISVSLLFIYG